MAIAGGPVGKLLASALLKGQRTFMQSQLCEDLMLANAAFCADLALALRRDTIHVHCSKCSAEFTVRRDMQEQDDWTYVYCPYCKAYQANINALT